MSVARFLKLNILSTLTVGLGLLSPKILHAACTPMPDMEGSIVVESCQYFKDGLSLPNESSKEKLVEGNKVKVQLSNADNGIILKGKFSKRKFIPARQTKREPIYRSAPPQAKERFDAEGESQDLSIFFATTNSKSCDQYKKGASVNLNAYFTCCEPRPNDSSPCALGTSYYTEEIKVSGKKAK